MIRPPLRSSIRASSRPSLWAALALASVLACGPERPPQPDESPRSARAKSEAADDPFMHPETDQLVITYAGDKGVFADTTSIAEVPEAARARVGVNVFGKPAPPGKVWVTDLSAPGADGRYPLAAVARDEFEIEVLGVGRASAFDLPGDLDPSDLLGDRVAAGKGGPVIVYKTSWCGVCKQLEAYLKKKGVEYVAKDIEKDRSAAAELQAKAKDKGVQTGSVPMIDVGGELLRGFDRKRLDQLL
jgi:glutaredoxin